MSPGGAARDCTGSFSAMSNTAGEEEELRKSQQRPYHGKPFLGSPPEMGNDDGDLQDITGPSEPPPAPPAVKKKRSLPGTPDPSAEVIALSPKTLLATNRFVCEICHKGFQRDQNLQLHRRGHNLPWKLRQRGGGGAGGGGDGGPARKRVYVCPEASCVHHNPARALGDLTGIKKHYCRKHGEKKWKCERCAKRYAVHSDWKAHSKVCGTREYKCDCGTVFSRRDSFVTHRAFCDALAQENNKLPQPMNMATVASTLQGQAHHLAPPSSQADDLDADADDFSPDTKSPHLTMLPISDDASVAAAMPLPPLSMASCMLSGLGGARGTPSPSPSFFAGNKLSPLGLDVPGDHPGMCFSPAGSASASMSATALLQKASQMGATASGYVTSLPHVGLGPMLGGPDRLPVMSPFGPPRATHGPLDGLPLDQTQLVGFDVGGLLPGQLYGGGAHQGVGSMTRTIGSLMHGAQQPQVEHQRPEPDGMRVAMDFMGVNDQSCSYSVAPFGPHIDPWA
ncbi:hypothetical protein ACP70R_036121 [Stipagrostis hirtigluma subsp. patula]